MADTYTTTSSIGDIVQTAYDRMAYKPLRSMLYFDKCATVKPTRQAMPGSSVVFTTVSDLSVVTTAIDESNDVDAVGLSETQVTVTLAEYGNAVITTAKLRGTTFLPAIDREAAERVGRNAGESMDTVVSDVLKAGDNVNYATGGTTDPTARNTVQPEDTLAAADVRRQRAELAAANVDPWNGNMYKGFIHPDVTYDFTGETGAAAWRDPHTYSQPAEIWNGEIGAFEGVSFIETSTAPIFADAGSSTTLTDVYATLFLGREALAKAYSAAVSADQPQVRFGAVTDKLRRFVPVGWYQLVGYKIFRQASLRRVESSSSIGSNS